VRGYAECETEECYLGAEPQDSNELVLHPHQAHHHMNRGPRKILAHNPSWKFPKMSRDGTFARQVVARPPKIHRTKHPHTTKLVHNPFQVQSRVTCAHKFCFSALLHTPATSAPSTPSDSDHQAQRREDPKLDLKRIVLNQDLAGYARKHPSAKISEMTVLKFAYQNKLSNSLVRTYTHPSSIHISLVLV
jgi:hypothetical protein